MQTAELDTTKEQAPTNGHDSTWQKFNDNDAFLQHIFSRKPAEKIVPVPDWEIEVLCRTLDAPSRLEIQLAAYDEETKKTDYRKLGIFEQVVIAGCYNPETGELAFTEDHLPMIKKYGGVVELLALTILRLSRMIVSDAEQARKN